MVHMVVLYSNLQPNLSFDLWVRSDSTGHTFDGLLRKKEQLLEKKIHEKNGREQDFLLDRCWAMIIALKALINQ